MAPLQGAGATGKDLEPLPAWRADLAGQAGSSQQAWQANASRYILGRRAGGTSKWVSKYSIILST